MNQTEILAQDAMNDAAKRCGAVFDYDKDTVCFSGDQLIAFAAAQPCSVPDGVWESLQRLIENGESMGPASAEDALLVAQYRRRLMEAPAVALPAEPVKSCPGIPRKGCDYLAACNSVCNKCGQVHHSHQLVAPAAPAAQADLTPSERQSWELHLVQADAIRELLDEHAPFTEGNLQTRIAQICLPVKTPAAQAEPTRAEVLRIAKEVGLIGWISDDGQHFEFTETEQPSLRLIEFAARFAHPAAQAERPEPSQQPDEIDWKIAGLLIEANCEARRSHTSGTSNWAAHMYRRIAHLLKTTAPEPAEPVALLSIWEQRAVLADLMGLECLINYHDCQETGADAREPGAGRANERRALELLGVGRAIIAADAELWSSEQKSAFGLRYSERAR